MEDKGEGTAVEPAGFWPRGGVVSEELKLSQTLVQRVIDERTSVLLVDVQDMHGGASESMVSMNLRSAMAVPLFDNQRVRGILYVDTARPGVRYNEDELQTVTATANAVAIKLRNQSMASELATAAQIQQAILPEELSEIDGYDLLARLDMCRGRTGASCWRSATYPARGCPRPWPCPPAWCCCRPWPKSAASRTRSWV